MGNNHSSTAHLVVCFATSYKQTIGRMVMATVSDSSLVLLSSFASGFFEYLLRMSLGMRDARMYRCLFSLLLNSTEDPLAQMRNARNRCIRVNNSLYETMSEVVAIWNSFAILIIWDIDLSNGALNRTERLWAAAKN